MCDTQKPIDLVALCKRLASYGQDHVLQFWEQLNAEQQTGLAKQVESIDLELVQELFRGATDSPDWPTLARKAKPPQAVRLAERHAGTESSLGMTPDQARARGSEALQAGEVGVLLVAGGQGTRLKFDLPKSLYPIGQFSQTTLLEIHVEKVRALSKRYDTKIPLYLMTSPATHLATERFLQENNRLGLDEADLFVFCQGSMPAVDAASGKLLMSSRGELFLSPDGHGGTLAALDSSRAIQHMQQRGIQELFYFQVDNPLAPVCDPELIGTHLLAASELTSLAVAKGNPLDKLGNFVMIDGRLHVIEYSDFPNDVAERIDTNGELSFWAGSVAIHVFNVNFLQRSLGLKDSLPFHIAQKIVPHIDVNRGDSHGEQVVPEKPNALKFERFIFDLLPQAKRPVVVEFAEEESFAPLKNAPGDKKDTPEYVRRMMADQTRTWLEAAGATVADGTDVEISPMWALDAEAVAARVEAGTVFNESVYLN